MIQELMIIYSFLPIASHEMRKIIRAAPTKVGVIEITTSNTSKKTNTFFFCQVVVSIFSNLRVFQYYNSCIFSLTIFGPAPTASAVIFFSLTIVGTALTAAGAS